jgi:hypothetical protein
MLDFVELASIHRKLLLSTTNFFVEIASVVGVHDQKKL